MRVLQTGKPDTFIPTRMTAQVSPTLSDGLRG